MANLSEKPAEPEGMQVPPRGGFALQQSLLHQDGVEDEAMAAFAGLDEAVIVDKASDSRLVRKIDLILMPMLCIVYGLNYLDKTTLSYANIMGLEKNLGLTGDNYSWLGSVFYFGYLGFEFPAARLLQRLPLAKYSAFCIVAWGVTIACFAAATDFAGAVTVRFFLGALEASVTPGFVLFVSQWYTKREQGMRVALWASFNGLAQIFGGLVAYGLSIREYSIPSWKIVFILTGVITILFGVIFWLLIPDSPLNARWLTKEDRVLALERVRANQQGIGNKRFKPHQFKEALLDPMTWAFVFFALVYDIPNGGLTNFFSLLIESFGFTAEQSLLYGTPGGAIEFGALILWGYLTTRVGNRILLGSAGLLIALLGAILVVALPAHLKVGRLIGYYLTQASVTSFVSLLSLIATNVAGYTKKTSVAGFVLIAYCAGNIVGPQTFRHRDSPKYVPAQVTIVVCWGVCCLDLAFIYCYYRWQNVTKDDKRKESTYVKTKNQEWMDLTDRENPELIYEL